MPSGPRVASGHAQIAEQARENVERRARRWEADEATIAATPRRRDATCVGAWPADRSRAQARRPGAIALARAHGATAPGRAREVLAAQRALAAVDAADRTEVFFALRAALCSTRAELIAFAVRVHRGVRRRRRAATTRSTSWGRSPSRRCRASASRRRATRRPAPSSCPRPPRGARRSCCARRTSPPTRTPSAPWRGGCCTGSRCAARCAAPAAPSRPGAGARRTTCARRSAPRCAPAVSCSSAATASRRRARGGSCWCAT